MLKTKKNMAFIILISFLLVVLFYYPFETNKKCGEYNLCWVKMGVYTYDYNSESGEKYFGKDIQFIEKVGGFWEYIGIKKIDCNR